MRELGVKPTWTGENPQKSTQIVTWAQSLELSSGNLSRCSTAVYSISKKKKKTLNNPAEHFSES